MTNPSVLDLLKKAIERIPVGGRQSYTIHPVALEIIQRFQKRSLLQVAIKRRYRQRLKRGY